MGLRNAEHEKYALLVGTGQRPWKAYQEVYACAKGTAYNGAKRLGQIAAIKERITQVQDRAALETIETSVLTRDEVRRRMTRLAEECGEMIPATNARGEVLQVKNAKTGELEPLLKHRDARVCHAALQSEGIEFGLYQKQSRSRKAEDRDPIDDMSYDDLSKHAERVFAELGRHRPTPEGAGKPAAGAADGESAEAPPPGKLPPLQ